MYEAGVGTAFIYSYGNKNVVYDLVRSVDHYKFSRIVNYYYSQKIPQASLNSNHQLLRQLSWSGNCLEIQK